MAETAERDYNHYTRDGPGIIAIYSQTLFRYPHLFAEALIQRAADYPLSITSNKGVNDFALFVGTAVEEETRQPCLLFWLSLEYGIVMYSIFLHILHQSVFRLYFAVPLPISKWGCQLVGIYTNCLVRLKLLLSRIIIAQFSFYAPIHTLTHFIHFQREFTPNKTYDNYTDCDWLIDLLQSPAGKRAVTPGSSGH